MSWSRSHFPGVVTEESENRISQNNNKHDGNKSDEEGSIDVGACSLCHSCVDFSDRAAFFKDDRQEDYDENPSDEDDSFFFRPNDPFLPVELYDPNNALVYCDSCDRLYHQKCHFVPVLSLPRGSWHCLYCQSRQAHRNDATCSRRLSKKKNPMMSKWVKAFFERVQNDKALATQATSTSGSDPTETVEASHLLFRSPPVADASCFEAEWETIVATLKTTKLREALQQVSNGLATQLAGHRRSTEALDTWTSTQQNAAHFTRQSQELRDLVLRSATCRYKIRLFLLAVQSMISSAESASSRLLLEWISYAKPNFEFVERALFPFGLNHQARMSPRTPEFRMPTLKCEDTIGALASPLKKMKEQKEEEEDSSGISLDELACCVCFGNESTDDNDLVLCDGAGCFRAYHQGCLPPSTSDDLDDEDWFCPLCRGFAQLLHYTQTEFMGDEWEQRRMVRQIEMSTADSRKKKRLKNSDENAIQSIGLDEDIGSVDSLASWENVDQVFPLAFHDYETAQKLHKGKRTADTDELLSRVLGLNDGDVEENTDEEDDQFDLEEFEEARVKTKAVDDEQGSHSSCATLVDMSSVELCISNDELAALSDDNKSNHGSEDEDTKPNWSRRLRRKGVGGTKKEEDPGMLDQSNIIVGKRDRTPVDYVFLNDALFGSIREGQVAKIDDSEDYNLRATESRDDSDSSSSGSGAGDEEDISEDDEGEGEVKDDCDDEIDNENDETDSIRLASERHDEAKKKGSRQYRERILRYKRAEFQTMDKYGFVKG